MSRQALKELPIYRKAVEMHAMSRAIGLCLNSNRDLHQLYSSPSFREEIAGCLMMDAALIRKQVALAASTSSLDIRQNSLQFISVMTRNLNSYCKGLEMDGMREREYLTLLRRELKGFRHAFRQWRMSMGQ
jgi:hypothetical protein